MSSMMPWSSTIIWNPFYMSAQTPPPPVMDGNVMDSSWFLPVVITSAIVGFIVLIVLIVALALCCDNYCKTGTCCGPATIEEGTVKQRHTASTRKTVVQKPTAKKSSKTRVKTRQSLYVVPQTGGVIPGFGPIVDTVVIGAKTMKTGGVSGNPSTDRVVKRREYITADYDDTTNDANGRRRTDGPLPSIQIQRRGGEGAQSAGGNNEDITVIVGNRRIVIPADQGSQTASNASLNVVPQRTVSVQGQQMMHYQQNAPAMQYNSTIPYHQQPIQPASTTYNQGFTVYPGDSFPPPPGSSSNHPLDGGPHSAMIQVSRSGGMADSIYPNISQSAAGNGYYY